MGNEGAVELYPHPASFLAEELIARKWSSADLAHHMPGSFGVNAVAIDIYLAVGESEPDNTGLRLGCTADAIAIGTSADLFCNLEAAWLADRGPNRPHAPNRTIAAMTELRP